MVCTYDGSLPWRYLPPKKGREKTSGKWWGPLGMVPLIINPIYTLYSGYLYVFIGMWIGGYGDYGDKVIFHMKDRQRLKSWSYLLDTTSLCSLFIHGWNQLTSLSFWSKSKFAVWGFGMDWKDASIHFVKISRSTGWILDIPHLGLSPKNSGGKNRSKEKLMACKQHNLRPLSCQQIFRCCLLSWDFEKEWKYTLYVPIWLY